MKIFTLHSGYDDYDESPSLDGVFSSKKKAEDFAKKFNITVNLQIKELDLDPLDSIVKSSKIPYYGSCSKKSQIYLTGNDYDGFIEKLLQFSYGGMRYWFLADNDKHATEIMEGMRQRFKDRDWKIKHEEILK